MVADMRAGNRTPRVAETFAGSNAGEIIDSARDAFIAMDADGVVTGWNRAAEAMFGYRQDEAVGQPLAPLIIPDAYRAQHDAGVLRFLRTRKLSVLGEHREYEGLRRSGDTFPIEITHWWLEDQGPVTFYAFIRDITDRKVRDEEIVRRRARESELTHRMLHDDLTGLANRSLAIEHITQLLARRARYGGDVAILFVDLDRFKLVNDNLGHAAGDDLLRTVAHRMRGTVRTTDVVARVAGDEFAVLCDRLAGPQEAEEVAHRVMTALAAPVDLGGERIRMRCSVGVALVTDPDETAEELMLNADAAMYRAKERGRGQIAIFDDDMRERMRNRLQMERELAECIDRGQLCVRYRPILDLRTDKLAGVQPIVCWQHPRLGLLAPPEFSPIAEQTGMMLPILLWGQQEWSADMTRWRAQRNAPLYLGIDLTSRQISDGELVRAILDTTRRNAVDPASIGIFVAELGSEPDDADAPVQAAAQSLAQAGISVGIYGFGAGTAVLSRVASPMFAAVKIAAQLARNVDTQPRARAVVGAVTDMARALDLTVFVDGVGTRAGRDCLAALGCDFAQGDEVGEAVPAGIVDAWL